MAIPVFQQAEAVSREATVAAAVDVLQEVLTPRLLAYIVGAPGVQIIESWTTGEGGPSEAMDRRLRVALEVTELLLTVDSPRVVRAWFAGMNPQLSDISPAQALREDRFGEVLDATRAFMVGG
jgi:hypothetical protein